MGIPPGSVVRADHTACALREPPTRRREASIGLCQQVCLTPAWGTMQYLHFALRLDLQFARHLQRESSRQTSSCLLHNDD
jgi:hypothetical protein